jgi:hypothetical protein
MRFDPLPFTIIATDVEKSSSRNDDLLIRMRADLRRILADSLARQGIDMTEVPVLDDGDGFRVLLPAARIAPQAALDPFIGRLGIELRNQRNASSAANLLRLRVAVHFGLLYGEEGGSFTGAALKDCARLLEAPAGRDLLRATPRANLVLLVTEGFFDLVVRGGGAIDPEHFRKIQVQVKETDGTAYAYLPDGGPGPAPDEQKPDEQAPPPGSSVFIIGDGHQFRDIYGGGNHGR